jgi:dolichol-phosphate mannosyltransferase
VLAGFAASAAPMILVYMADDDYNAAIVGKMVQKIREGCDVVAASRFIPGGEMKNCSSLIKELITRLGAFLVFHFGGEVHDPTNAFRMFTRRVIDTIEIESSQGFTFSIELLVKALRLKWKVAEVPALWIEREDKPSRFRVFAWLPHYLPWAFYALATHWLKRGPTTVMTKSEVASTRIAVTDQR